MKGLRVGYIRVSSTDQNTARQLEGIELDKTFTDKLSGKNVDRVNFQAMIDYVREGDTIIVHSMDRLSRNLDDLRQTVHMLVKKGVKIEFVEENLTFKGDDSPMSMLLLSMMGAFAEFERSIILERQKEGILIAKKEGKYRGRKPVLNKNQVIALRERALKGESKSTLAKEYNISRNSVYQYLARYHNETLLN